MPVDHTLALQTAIVAVVTGDTDLDQLIAGRIYDYVPADPVFPFCRIGPMTAAPFEANNHNCETTRSFVPSRGGA